MLEVVIVMRLGPVVGISRATPSRAMLSTRCLCCCDCCRRLASTGGAELAALVILLGLVNVDSNWHWSELGLPQFGRLATWLFS